MLNNSLTIVLGEQIRFRKKKVFFNKDTIQTHTLIKLCELLHLIRWIPIKNKKRCCNIQLLLFIRF